MIPNNPATTDLYLKLVKSYTDSSSSTIRENAIETAVSIFGVKSIPLLFLGLNDSFSPISNKSKEFIIQLNAKNEYKFTIDELKKLEKMYTDSSYSTVRENAIVTAVSIFGVKSIPLLFLGLNDSFSPISNKSKEFIIQLNAKNEDGYSEQPVDVAKIKDEIKQKEYKNLNINQKPCKKISQNSNESTRVLNEYETKNTTKLRLKGFIYDVALSFAGEDRTIVDNIAKELIENNINVFYDKYEKTNLWGKRLSAHFQKTYGENTCFVIVFVSKHYSLKDWTNFEFTIARGEARNRTAEFILPVRLDNTLLFGLPEDMAYLDYNTEGIEGIVSAIVDKLNANT